MRQEIFVCDLCKNPILTQGFVVIGSLVPIKNGKMLEECQKFSSREENDVCLTCFCKELEINRTQTRTLQDVFGDTK